MNLVHDVMEKIYLDMHLASYHVNCFICKVKAHIP